MDARVEQPQSWFFFMDWPTSRIWTIFCKDLRLFFSFRLRCIQPAKFVYQNTRMTLTFRPIQSEQLYSFSKLPRYKLSCKTHLVENYSLLTSRDNCGCIIQQNTNWFKSFHEKQNQDLWLERYLFTNMYLHEGFTRTPKFGLGATSFYISTNTITTYKIAKVR